MQIIIFLNGKAPGLKIIKKFLENRSFIIAADGGANFLIKARIKPDLILGDLDSIKKTTVEYFRKRKVRIRKIKDQDTNDFEKALMYCRGTKFKDIIVFGATGLRTDHTLNNFSVLKRYQRTLDIRLISDEFEIFYLKKSYKFQYKPNETISLLALPVAYKIKTSGLMYELNNENLEFGIRESTLNKSVSDTIQISHQSGSLLLFRKHFIK